jgi:hypothetical protein
MARAPAHRSSLEAVCRKMERNVLPKGLPDPIRGWAIYSQEDESCNLILWRLKRMRRTEWKGNQTLSGG